MRLSQLDRDIWHYLWTRFDEGVGAPSMADMAQACHCSTPKVIQAIDRLEVQGSVTWQYLRGRERRAARGCLTVAPPEVIRAEDRIRAMAERRLREKEAAKMRMRRNRAIKASSLTDLF